MNLRPIAEINVGKFFSEMAILFPANAMVVRIKTHYVSSANVKKAVNLLLKMEKGFA